MSNKRNNKIEAVKKLHLKKIEDFKNEIGEMVLNEEQKKIYDAFTKVQGRKIYVTVCDSENTILKILLESQTEVKKILLKHYKGSKGIVTASEILNMFDVVRTGDKYFNLGNYVYTKVYTKGGKRYRTVLKIFNNGSDAVLKSFNTKDEETKTVPSNRPSTRGKNRPAAKSKRTTAKVTKKNK